MKNIVLLGIMLLMALTMQAQSEVPQGYVDLGLPSGTIWKTTNESGFYTYEQAVNKYGMNLPTKEQFEELKTKCTWTWDGNGYMVAGPNGNFIVLPASEWRDCGGKVHPKSVDGTYWSSTSNGSDDAWELLFYLHRADMHSVSRCRGLAVRLVQTENQEHKTTKEQITADGFVDLGLPSRTLWKNENESGFYTHEQAMYMYGNNLPTKEQFEELKNKCSWSWYGRGYKVTGPNGNSIVFPAKRFRNCAGDVGTLVSGNYWSSALYGSVNAWGFFFLSNKIYMDSYNRCNGFTIRLVQNR